MNSKQLKTLLILAAIVGIVGVYVKLSNNHSWKSTNRESVNKLFSQFPINDVAQIVIHKGADQLNLVKQGDVWQVRERFNYPANFNQLSDFLRKVWELKPVQKIIVGASQFARLELVPPSSGATTGTGTLVEFKDKEGKQIKSLIFGKTHMKQAEEGSPYGGAGFPDGRYVMEPNQADVSLVSETFGNLEPKADQWVSHDFVKIEKIREVSVSGSGKSGSGWKLSRENETADMRFSDGSSFSTDKVKLSTVANAFSSPSFTEVVAPEVKPVETGLNNPTSAVVKTFDGLNYNIKIGKKNAQDNFYVQVAVDGDLQKERIPGKDEKPEDKAKLDKEFKDNADKLTEKLNREKSYEKWTYLVPKWVLDPFLKEKKDFAADTKAEPAKVAPNKVVKKK
jgi:hypothetical protein